MLPRCGPPAPVTAREVRAAAGTSALGVGGGPYGENRYSPAANRPVINPLPGLAGHVGPALRRAVFRRSGGGQSRPPLRIGGHCPAGFGRSRAPPLRGMTFPFSIRPASVGVAPSSVTAFGRATFSPRRRRGGVFLFTLYPAPAVAAAAGWRERAEQSPAPTSGLLLPFTIHPAVVGAAPSSVGFADTFPPRGRRHGGRFVNRPYGETATLSTAGNVPHCPPPHYANHPRSGYLYPSVLRPQYSLKRRKTAPVGGAVSFCKPIKSAPC